MNIKYIRDDVEHQNIGGKDFIVDEEITKRLSNEEIIKQTKSGNWACYNFIMRRSDFNENFPYKLYYGKVEGLGYIMAEDEFKD